MSRFLKSETKPQTATAVRVGVLQRSRASGHEPETVPPVVHEVVQSPGQPLDAETRAFFEPCFGHDFTKVRVHTDARAAESAQAVNAQAFAYGKHMVFNEDKYRPASVAGKRLIEHELAHIIEQSEGAKKVQCLQIDSDVPASNRSGLEKEWSTANPEGRVLSFRHGHLLLWNFDVAKATLKAEHKRRLEELVNIWKIVHMMNPQASISVRGCASRTGNRQFNQKLSEMRANAVWDYLKGAGIDTSRIEIDWHGDTQPVASENLLLGKGMAQNRSVEVKIIGMGREPDKKDEPKAPEPKPPIKEPVKDTLKFIDSDKDKGLKEKVCESLPEGACEWIEKGKAASPPRLGDVLKLKHLQMTIGEVSKAQTINERHAWAQAFAYTFVSYCVNKKRAELPPGYFPFEPKAREIWDEVSTKVWLALHLNARNNPSWGAIEAYIKQNPEEVLNEVYRVAGEKLKLGVLRDFHLTWPMPPA